MLPKYHRRDHLIDRDRAISIPSTGMIFDINDAIYLAIARNTASTATRNDFAAISKFVCPLTSG